MMQVVLKAPLNSNQPSIAQHLWCINDHH